MREKILIAGGGTGGHVYPAIATIEALREKGDFVFLFVGGNKGIEMNIIPKYDIASESVWISGFQRYFTWKNFLFPIKLLVSMLQSRRIVKNFNPDVVVGTGGYVTGPVLYIASKMGIPVLIQEQDVFPGVTTRLLKKHANRICLAFNGARQYFKDYLDKIVITGNPVRKNLTLKSKAEALEKWNLNPEKSVIFVFGGSQGARAINKALIEIIPKLIKEHGIQILWQTGEKNYLSIKESKIDYEEVKILPFIQEIEYAYSAADIIVSRAGAITLAELAIVQKPVILVPYPFAAGKHQEHNAKLIEQEGAAIMLLEEGGWEEKLLNTIVKLLEDQLLRSKMTEVWQKLAKPNAANLIADEVINLIDKN